MKENNKRLNTGDTLRSEQSSSVGMTTIPQSASPTAPFTQGSLAGGFSSPLPYRANENKVTNKGGKILNVITIISVLLISWAVISYIDIVSHNLTTQEYSPFNMWEIIFKFAMRK